MNSRHGNAVLAAIVSLLWLAGGCDLRAAEERPVSLDCGKDRTPLALIVCSDQKATAAERRTATAYLALYFSLDEKDQASFRDDHMRWVNDLIAQCTSSSNLFQKILGAAPAAPSRECVTRAYMLRAESYRKKLRASALEEAKLSSNELRGIQRRLLELKFLSGKIDGMFGAATRLAIRNYQMSIGHAQANFLTGDERSMLLAPASTPPKIPTQTPAPAETSMSAPTPMSAPETPPEAAFQQPSTGQSNQNLESRLPNVEATTPATGQSGQRTSVEDVTPFTAAVAEQTDEPAKKSAGEPKPWYFTHGRVLLLITILAGMGLFLWTGMFLLNRLHSGPAFEVDDASPAVPVARLSGPNRIPTASAQLVAAGPRSEQKISDQQVGAGAISNEDAIANIIADLVRKNADAR